MTLDELMAIVGAGTTAGAAATGTELAGQAAEERSDIRTGQRETEEAIIESEMDAEKQAEDVAKARTLGTIIGTAIGGPAGAALFSSLFQIGAKGKRKFKEIGSYIKPGMFYTQTRKDHASDISSTNEFIKRANQRFATDVLGKAGTDAFTAYSFSKAYPWLKDKLPWGSPPVGKSTIDLSRYASPPPGTLNLEKAPSLLPGFGQSTNPLARSLSMNPFDEKSPLYDILKNYKG